MNKFYFAIFFTCTAFISVESQNFVFNPTDNYEDDIPLNSYTEHKVYMTNLTGGNLILAWESIFIDFPIEWNVTTCDNGGCYTGIPPSGTMQPLFDTVSGFLRLTVNAHDYPGTGIVVFNVYDTKAPEESDTLTFTIHAHEVTGIEISAREKGLLIYPNPASDVVNISGYAKEDDSFRLVNLQGQIVDVQKTSEYPGSVIDISGLPKGIYFVLINNNKGLLERKKLIIN